MEIPCDDALPSLTADARVQVKSATLTASTDEEKGKCKIIAEFILVADCDLFILDEIPALDDVFSTECEITYKKANAAGRYLTNVLRFTERVSGVASLSEPINYSNALQAAVLPRAEIVCRQGEEGGEAEGVLFAELILSAEDSSHKTARLSLPFLFPVQYESGLTAVAEAMVCGSSVRQRREGEAEAEATLKVTVKLYRETQAEYISEIEEGEPYPENDCAISIFIPRTGDGLWELAKQLKRPPETIEKSNPELHFPVQEGERIFVYRQKQ
jgi:hypothetical protein